MAAICRHCGAACDIAGRFCASCGQHLGESHSPSETPSDTTSAPKPSGRWGKWVAVIVPVVSLIGMIIILVSFSGPEETVKNVMNAYRREDVDGMVNKACVSVLGENLNEGSFAYAYFERLLERDMSTFIDSLGDGYDVDYEILETAELSETECKDALKLLPKEAQESVDKIAESIVELTVDGDDEQLSFKRTVRLGCENGYWRVISIN